MRITGGVLAGRKLRVPQGNVRPTSDRVREALFAIVSELEGARVLDLFAGSGALGLEALSRGAASAVFVERDRRVLAGLRANIEALVPAGVAGAGRTRVVATDALRALRELARAKPFDLVLLDPPYQSALAPRVLAALAPARLLAPDARVVVESDRRAPPGPAPGLALGDARRYGDTLLTFYRAAQPAQETGSETWQA